MGTRLTVRQSPKQPAANGGNRRSADVARQLPPKGVTTGGRPPTIEADWRATAARLFRRVLIFLAKLEGYQIVFTAGAIVGMVVEAGMMVALMKGHSLWIGAVYAH